jgi:RNA polymerase II subunit A small phosphatase-like protein
MYGLCAAYVEEEMGKIYEVVVFTASLSKYADPLLDLLDTGGVIRHRLFRESCYPFQGNYVKDLTSLGREMGKTIIIDNSPHSYAFQPQNALPISSFIDDPRDNDLLDAIPYLQELAKWDWTKFNPVHP